MKWKTWTPWLVFVLIFFGALATGAVLYRLENMRYQAQFILAATERMNLIEVGIPPYFRPVRHIGAVFQEEVLSIAGFRRIAEGLPLARSSVLLALQWIRREPAGPARELFPIRYNYPQGADIEYENGTDLGDDPVQRRSLEQAAMQRHLFIAPWYHANGQVRFRAFRPVSRVKADEKEVLGFVSGIYRVDELLKELLCPHETDAISLFVSDPRSEIRTSFYCSGGEVQTIEAETKSQASNHRLTRTVHIGGAPGAEGAHWRITVVGEPDAFTASRWIPFIVGFGGFLLGGVLALFLRSLLGREAQVRELVRHRTEELARRTEQLQIMNSELEQFAYVASHDLKAPLRAVSQLASWIDEDAAENLDQENRERLKLMRERVIRMDRLIEGLLAYSRTGRVSGGTREPVPLEPLLDQLINDLTLPVGFQVNIEKPLPTLDADTLHLKQIFQNLITNAAAHHDHPESGMVRISAEEETRQWRLEIADDGPGIPTSERERIFRIFTSLGSPSGTAHTGIGLSIVRKLVRSYGGKIDVVDNLPRGARFRIWWPK